MPLSPAQRRVRARMGGHAVHAKHGSEAIAARARRGFMARFERQVDPDGTLSPAERERRARHAMKAHMNAMALKSVRSRRERSMKTPAEYAEHRRSNPAERLA